MNSWWWVPIGLAAWFLVAIVASLLIGSVLGHSSRIREFPSQEPADPPEAREPPQGERQAS